MATPSIPTSSAVDAHANRQAVMYCPYCSEETLFPLEGGGWECRSCLRAFSVTFRGLVSRAVPGDSHRTAVAPGLAPVEEL